VSGTLSRRESLSTLGRTGTSPISKEHPIIREQRNPRGGSRDQRTNRRIRAREVRVVGSDGSQLGVMPIEAALERARTEGLDLVEISPMAAPPVCKIMDYGKFKYEEKKKASESRRAQVTVQLKEVKLRPKTEEHDYEFKVRNMRRFLEEGNKAKVVIQFRGREITHKSQGTVILDDVAKDLQDISVVEQAPRMEGRLMFMILAPTPKVAQKARELVRQAAAGAKRAASPPTAKQAASPNPASTSASTPATPTTSASEPAEAVEKDEPVVAS
jgi:translation initiation factor IF-3